MQQGDSKKIYVYWNDPKGIDGICITSRYYIIKNPLFNSF
jgi:hypothetical protein